MLKEIKDKELDDKRILCECGILVKGTSKKHRDSNLEKHKQSNQHKELMQVKTPIKLDKEKIKSKGLDIY